MESNKLNKHFAVIMQTGLSVTIGITGVSMLPYLQDGDFIDVKKVDDYRIGSILVFCYKSEILVHRLIMKDGFRFFCKGDNALRIEDVLQEDVLGEVIRKNGEPVISPCWETVFLSRLENQIFRKNKYDVSVTRSDLRYQKCYKIIANKKERTMRIKRNEKVQFLNVDETSLAVFNSETETTILFDGIGIDILNCIINPIDLESIYNEIQKKYSGPESQIRNDIEDFLLKCVKNDILEVVEEDESNG